MDGGKGEKGGGQGLSIPAFRVGGADKSLALELGRMGRGRNEGKEERKKIRSRRMPLRDDLRCQCTLRALHALPLQ